MNKIVWAWRAKPIQRDASTHMKGPNWRSQEVVIGGIAGAFFLSLALTIFHALFQPRMLNDGMYTVVYAFSSPPGWLMGALLMHCKTRELTNNAPYGAGIVIAGGAILSLLLSPFIGLILLMPVGLVIEIGKAVF